MITRVRDDYDVLIVGGGTAGAIAGIASARTGARTLVVESAGYLGGILSFGMSLIGSVDNDGRWALGGIGRELADRLKAKGEATAAQMSPLWNSILAQAPEATRIELLRMCEESGANLLLHTMLVDAVTTGGHVTHVVVANKAGLEVIPASVFVDASGDADLVARAGGEWYFGRQEDGLAQPSSRIFMVGGVRFSETLEHLEDAPTVLRHFYEILRPGGLSAPRTPIWSIRPISF